MCVHVEFLGGGLLLNVVKISQDHFWPFLSFFIFLAILSSPKYCRMGALGAGRLGPEEAMCVSGTENWVEIEVTTGSRVGRVLRGSWRCVGQGWGCEIGGGGGQARRLVLSRGRFSSRGELRRCSCD